MNSSTLTKQYRIPPKGKGKGDCIRKMTIISELQKGHRAAADLLLLPAFRDSAIDLTDKIINSFSNSLSMLSDQFEPPLPRSGDVDSISKNIITKIRRGCYKRRKTGQTREAVTPCFAADGYAWRKYGQKTILNSQYPRQYYRCTHKTEQGCQATKWVQRVSDHETPSLLSSVGAAPAAAVELYRTLYEGEHTCKTSPPTPPQIGSSSSANSASDYNLYLDFGDPTASTTINVPSSTSSTNITAIDYTNNNNNNQCYHPSSGSGSGNGSGGGGTHDGGCLFFASITSTNIGSTASTNIGVGDLISAKLEPAAAAAESGPPYDYAAAAAAAAATTLHATLHHHHQINTTTDDFISFDDFCDGIFDVDMSPTTLI